MKERIQTALIMEDDADWDVMLKSQMQELAQGVQHIQGYSGNGEPASPYGDSWDILWTGHCGASWREDQDLRQWVIRNDPTVIPRAMSEKRRLPNFNHTLLQGDNIRVIYEISRSMCTTSYAISYRAAQRLLYEQSVLGHPQVVDGAFSRLCHDRYLGIRCFASFPALIAPHRAAGPVTRDSDRADGDSENVRLKAETPKIVFPTRVNLERLMAENKKIPSQYPADTMLRELDMDMKLPKGEGILLRQQDYRRSG